MNSIGWMSLSEAFQIAIVHLRLARGDVAQLAFAHPLFQPVHQAEEMIERVHDEQQRLVMIDFEGLVDGPLELEGIALNPGRRDAVLELAERAEQPASVS